MSDPLSISVSAAGLISLGLEVTKGLIQYYESWKDSQDNVATMLESLEALFKTIKLLNEKILVTEVISRQSVDRLAESVISCASAIQRLKDKLRKAQSTKPWLNASIRRLQYPFREKTLAKMCDIVSDLRSNLSLALDALHVETGTSSLQKLNLMSGKVDAIDKRVAEREASELLEWLTPLTFQEKQSDVLCKRQAGSGQWLLGNHDFRDWVNGDTRVLWCTGMPGAGKTVLSSIIIDYLETTCTEHLTGVAYTYCQYNEASQTVKNLLGSLLRQLAQQNTSVLDEVKSLKTRCTSGGNDPRPLSVSDISTALSMASQMFRETYFVIDALDECSEENGIRGDFVACLLSCLPNIRLLVTSRQIPTIGACLKPHFRFDVRADDGDLRSFIEAQMDHQPRLASMLGNDREMKKEVVGSVAKKANGMWLLAILHMDSLAQEDNVRDLRTNLQHLPEGIDASYDKIIQRIQKQGHRLVTRAEETITLINCAFRPLSLQEVLCALTVRPGDTFFDSKGTPTVSGLLSACCGLVVLEEESNVLQLVHHSAGEYFKQRGQRQAFGSHEWVASVLLTYIDCLVCTDQDCGNWLPKFTEIEYYEPRPPKELDAGDTAYALCTYAVDMWNRHARIAYEREKTSDETQLNLTQQEGKNRSGWDVEKCLLSLQRKNVRMPLGGRYPYHCLTCKVHPNKIHFIPKFAPRSGYRNRLEALEMLLTKDLSTRDIGDGYIYVCKPHGDIGLIMIGWTARSVKKRLGQRAEHCGHDIHVEYPKSNQMHRVPFAKRLEALVNAELGDFGRIELKCAKCSNSHYTWFETTVPIAIAAIEKWAEWLQKEPYEERSQVWVLKDEYRRNLPELLHQTSILEPSEPSRTLRTPPLKSPETWASLPFAQDIGPHTLLF